MIKVDNKNVEIRGKFLEIINDLTNVMKVIREGAPTENDERKVDGLFYAAIELSKKKANEITPEDEKVVWEKVKERLSEYESNNI